MILFHFPGIFWRFRHGEKSGTGTAAEVDGGIIADVEAAVHTFHFGIAADKGIAEYDLVEIGISADDRILDDGMVQGGVFADSHIGTDDRIADIAAFGNIYRRDDDRIFIGVRFKGITAEFLEQGGV